MEASSFAPNTPMELTLTAMSSRLLFGSEAMTKWLFEQSPSSEPSFRAGVPTAQAAFSITHALQDNVLSELRLNPPV